MDTERLDRAMDLHNRGQSKEALRQLQELAQDTPDDEEKGVILLIEVNCLTALGRLEEARKLLQDVRILLRGVVEYGARIELTESRLNSAAGEYREALTKLDRMVEKYSELLHLPEVRDLYEDLQFSRGMLLTEFDRFDEARPILEEVEKFENFDRQRDGEFYCRLGMCYLELAETQLAKDALLKAVELPADEKTKTAIHYYLGRVYLRLGAYAQAKQHLETSQSLAEQAGVPKKHIYDALGKASLGLGLKGEANYYAELAKTVK